MAKMTVNELIQILNNNDPNGELIVHTNSELPDGIGVLDSDQTIVDWIPIDDDSSSLKINSSKTSNELNDNVQRQREFLDTAKQAYSEDPTDPDNMGLMQEAQFLLQEAEDASQEQG